MFDISFSELAVIGVVALVVIGPERLPKVARTVGHLMGRAQRYVNDVKADIQREIELDEFRNLKQTMDDAAAELNTSMRETENSIRSAGQALQADLDSAASDAKRALDFSHKVEAAETTPAAAEPAAPEPVPVPVPESAPAEPAAHQAELPLAEPAPAASTEPVQPAAPAAPAAKPPANATTGTPT